MKDKKLFAIGVLTVTAAILIAANSYTAHQAQAFSVKDRDYQVVTARNSDGSDALYIADNRTGQIAVFAWDATVRGVRLRDRKVIGDMFATKR